MVIDYGKLIFGDVDSSDYGIYISGEGVYNAPERAVEFVTIPGRNGTLEIDQGRYENIEVIYPAMVLADDQEQFREKLSAFRNAILSQKGYQRLEDSYHPDEYRMGVYHSGLSVSELLTYHQVGEFELTFNCKPQRWLTAGELPIPLKSGDVLQNPTLFDSSPLVEIEGYGDVTFNGYAINLENALIGDVEIIPRASEGTNSSSLSKDYRIDNTLFNVGDDITIEPITFAFDLWGGTKAYSAASYEIDQTSNITPTVKVPSYSGVGGSNSLGIVVTTPQMVLDAISTADSSVVKKAIVNVTATIATISGGGTDSITLETKVTLAGKRIRLEMSVQIRGVASVIQIYWNLPSVMVDSTVNVLGHPTYIDCDLGDAYRIINGEYQSLNKYVELGSDLPKLAPGSNKVTKSYHVTELRIVPRWWRI